MIVFLASAVLFGVTSWIAWQRLMALRSERQQAVESWAHDPYVKERNRRAVLLFAMWSMTLSLLIGSLVYVDISYQDISRTAGLTERVILLIIAITLLFDRE